MMQANVATAVEGYAFLRIFDLPERHDAIPSDTKDAG
jgi:hypothetical protein